MGQSKLRVGFWVSFVLGFSGLVFMGCSSDEIGASTYCKTYESRLRECGLISGGRFGGCVDYGDKAEVCETRCLRDASCANLGFFFCGPAGDNDILKCFRSCSGETPFKCAGGGAELGPFVRCNGIADCPGGDDEASCDTFEPQYKCRNVAQSVSQALYCDGKSDCSDGSDEPPGCAPASACSDGSMYSIWSYCNGRADCPDGTDEPAGCATNTCPK